MEPQYQIGVEVDDELNVTLTYPLGPLTGQKFIVPGQFWDQITDMRNKKLVGIVPETNVRAIEAIKKGRVN